MYNKVIVMPTWCRADYTQKVLEGLKSCDGIEEYKLLIHAEPDFPDVIDTINSIDGLNKEIILNSTVLGATPNTYECMEHGFSLSDFVIYIEDDDVPSKDFLKYFEWARDTYENNTDILNIAGHSMYKDLEPAEYYKVERGQWFTPWGWGTWIDRWKEIKEKWDQTIGWDTIINHNVRGERYEIKPKLARIQNIGATRSVNVPSPEWHAENHFNAFWVGSIDIGEGIYHE